MYVNINTERRKTHHTPPVKHTDRNMYDIMFAKCIKVDLMNHIIILVLVYIYVRKNTENAHISLRI